MIKNMKWLQLRLVRSTGILIILIVVLLVADTFCYRLTLPLTIDESSGLTTLHVGSETLALGNVGIPTRLQFGATDKVIHEYQIDGTDTTNNFTLDQNYLDWLSSSLYYRFQAWMRDLDGTSQWTNLTLQVGQQQKLAIASPEASSSVALPGIGTWQIQMQLQRPETPRTLTLFMKNHTSIHIILDRNDRYIRVTQSATGMNDALITSTFFPTDVLPFAAMVLDFIVRTLLWSLFLLLLMCIIALPFVRFYTLPPAGQSGQPSDKPTQDNNATTQTGNQQEQEAPTFNLRQNRGTIKAIKTFLFQRWQQITEALHPIALVALGISLCFVVWIARVQYNGQPHIFDAQAYLFAAKMYASGHLSLPASAVIDRFPGPFMVSWAGRWFTQYPPGTSLTLVPGIWLGVPWLVEPVLGTLALFGSGLIAARLYNRRIATLAVLLGTLSPFYSYLAASYLSHAIALFYLVWGLWMSIRFLQGGAKWLLPVAALFFGMGALTRDLVGIMFIILTLLAVCALNWQQIQHNWRRWLLPGALFLVICLCFAGITLAFNVYLTQNAWISPRTLFFPGDRWGFGANIGFYGQHTIAAGLVNLDENLTLLAIDLYGWPFYCTLAFIALPFITRRATKIDWALLLCASIMTASFVGYFYHGIYLGPRYLFETLPFLLMLTARGIITLGTYSTNFAYSVFQLLKDRQTQKEQEWDWTAWLPTFTLVTLLVGCNLIYFLPRQIEIHQNYSGLPVGENIDLTAIYHPTVHNAVIVTGDSAIYQYDLFALNDPALHGDILYALADTDTQYAELQRAYPQKVLYRLNIRANGSIFYTRIAHK